MSDLRGGVTNTDSSNKPEDNPHLAEALTESSKANYGGKGDNKPKNDCEEVNSSVAFDLQKFL